MLNILGEDSGRRGLIQAQSMIQNSLSISGAKAHWYEKTDVKKNRKVKQRNLNIDSFHSRLVISTSLLHPGLKQETS